MSAACPVSSEPLITRERLEIGERLILFGDRTLPYLPRWLEPGSVGGGPEMILAEWGKNDPVWRGAGGSAVLRAIIISRAHRGSPVVLVRASDGALVLCTTAYHAAIQSLPWTDKWGRFEFVIGSKPSLVSLWIHEECFNTRPEPVPVLGLDDHGAVALRHGLLARRLCSMLPRRDPLTDTRKVVPRG